MNIVLGKRCGKCWRILPSGNYYRLKNGRLYCYCKECHQKDNQKCAKAVPDTVRRPKAAKRMRDWRNANRARNRISDRTRKAELYRTSPEYKAKVRQRNQSNWKANKPILQSKRREWGETEHGKTLTRAASIRRKSRKKSATVQGVDEAVKAILTATGIKCFYCSASLTRNTVHIEHKTPLIRGGLHSADNIVPSCAPCNLRKGTRTAEEFICG